MVELFVTGKTLAEAHNNAFVALFRKGEICDCENQDQKSRQMECSMTYVVEEPFSEPMISIGTVGGPYDFERYRQEMLDGALDKRIGHGWDYTYHDRITNYPQSQNNEDKEKRGINQIQFVIDELTRCRDSRRAVIVVRSAEDIDVNAGDPACLQHIHYFIRNNKLHCKVLFRSNDAAEATVMNAWALVLLQKRIADILGVEVGTYTHRANSFHAYEKDWAKLEGYVNRIEAGDPFAFEYEGDFEEAMEEARDEVAKTFKDLLDKIS